jgi:hypothetical protein
MFHIIFYIQLVLTLCGGFLYVWTTKGNSDALKDNPYSQRVFSLLQDAITGLNNQWNQANQKDKLMIDKILSLPVIIVALFAVILLLQVFIIVQIARIKTRLNNVKNDFYSFRGRLQYDNYNRQQEAESHQHRDGESKHQPQNSSSTNAVNKGHEEPSKEQSKTQKEQETATDKTATDNAEDEKPANAAPVVRMVTEYLKAGNDDQNYFFPGNNDPEGAYFVVSYDAEKKEWVSKLRIKEGVDISNLRVIKYRFLQNVISFEGKVTLNKAKGYQVTSPGRVTFSKEEGIWRINSKIKVKLI